MKTLLLSLVLMGTVFLAAGSTVLAGDDYDKHDGKRFSDKKESSYDDHRDDKKDSYDYKKDYGYSSYDQKDYEDGSHYRKQDKRDEEDYHKDYGDKYKDDSKEKKYFSSDRHDTKRAYTFGGGWDFIQKCL